MNNITYLPKFTVLSIDDRYDYITVMVRISKKDWEKANKGVLYGVDITNEVYKTRKNIMPCPTVSDKTRAKNGFKYITLHYGKVLNHAK